MALVNITIPFYCALDVLASHTQAHNNAPGNEAVDVSVYQPDVLLFQVGTGADRQDALRK